MSRIVPTGSLSKPSSLHSKRLTREAVNHTCQAMFGALIGLPCSGDVMFCHASTTDKGTGLKGPDWWGFFGCDQCHRLQDGRDNRLLKDILCDSVLAISYRDAVLTAIRRTLQKQFDAGILRVSA
jgi:hypothetical protein